MRQTVAFILVLLVIGVMGYLGWRFVVDHGRKYGGQECEGADNVKCPLGYECVDKNGKTIKLGAVGSCRFLLKGVPDAKSGSL